MKTIILIAVFTTAIFTFQIEKNHFYDVLSSNSVENLNTLEIQLEKNQKTAINRAYKGAVIAKKASFQKGAAAKIKTFKSGIKLLEIEIAKHPKEVEFRFLRLTIQEHAPKILKYKKNINEDVQLIYTDYSKQNKALKSIISHYAKKSTVLHSEKLK